MTAYFAASFWLNFVYDLYCRTKIKCNHAKRGEHSANSKPFCALASVTHSHRISPLAASDKVAAAALTATVSAKQTRANVTA